MVAAELAAQQIWKVHHVPGPGVDFTDLPQAVAAAAPGDEIWVYWFNGQTVHYFTAPAIDKPLRIVGFQVGAPPGTQGTTEVEIRGLCVITNIRAGQQVTLNGIAFTQQGNTPAGIVAVDCDGDIILEDLWMSGRRYASFAVHLERCHNVVIRGCDIYMAGRPVTVIDSNLLMSTTVVNYLGPLGMWPLYSYSPSTETMRLVRSNATIVGSIVRSIGPGLVGINPTYPVVVQDSVMRVGPGSNLWSPWLQSYFPIGTNTIQIDPRATLQVMPVPPPPPSSYLHSVYHNYVVVGEPYSVAAAGPPGGFAVLMVGDYASPSIPTSFGPLAIDPASIVFGSVVPLSSTTGSYLWFESCPATALVGYPYAFQAVMLAPNGTIQLSQPSPFVAGWQHGRIP
jgi:hypothetical protein